MADITLSKENLRRIAEEVAADAYKKGWRDAMDSLQSDIKRLSEGNAKIRESVVSLGVPLDNLGKILSGWDA